MAQKIKRKMYNKPCLLLHLASRSAGRVVDIKLNVQLYGNTLFNLTEPAFYLLCTACAYLHTSSFFLFFFSGGGGGVGVGGENIFLYRAQFFPCGCIYFLCFHESELFAVNVLCFVNETVHAVLSQHFNGW